MSIKISYPVKVELMSGGTPSTLPVTGSLPIWDGTKFSMVAGTIVPIASVTTTTYTLALTDAAYLIRANNASAITITVPLNSSVAFRTGTVITVEQVGNGQVTIAPTGGVTLNKYYGLKTKGQYSMIQMVKVDTDTWTVIGGVA